MTVDSEAIRKRLLSLDYGKLIDCFDQTSLPLVQKLLSDLISTTQAYREQKMKSSTLEQEIYSLEDRVKPLESRTRNLEQENLILHQEIISLKDEKDAVGMKNMDLVKTLQTRMHDLEFMNSQLKASLAIEKQHTRKALAKVEDFTEKIVLPTNSSASDRQKVFERIQKIDLETGLAPVDIDRPFLKVNPEFVDLVAIAEEKVEAKEKMLREEQSKSRSAIEESTLLREMVSKRDLEIQRLSNKLMQSGNTLPIFKNVNADKNGGEYDGNIEAAQDRIHHLEMQVEALNFHLESLESEIANSDSTKAGVINDIQSQKDRVELDLEKERKKNEVLIKQVNNMEGIVKDLEGLRKVKATSTTQSTVAKNSKLVQELNTKLNTMTTKLDNCQKRLSLALKSEKKAESETRELKDLVCKLEKQIKEAKTPSTVTATVKTAVTDVQSRDTTTSELPSIKLELKKLEAAKSLLSSENKTLSSKLDVIQGLVAEKDLKIKSISTSQTSLQAQIEQYEKEREMLIKSLEEFENETNIVISNVEKVTSERDSLKSLYIQVNSELERLRNQPKPKTLEDPHSGPILLEINELRQKNNYLSESEKKLMVQVDALKSDLNAILTRQRENGNLANDAVTALDHELLDLKKTLKTSEEEMVVKARTIENLEEEIQGLKVKNREALAQGEGDQKKSSQLQLEIDKLKLEIRDLHSNKVTAEERIAELQGVNTVLEKRVKDLIIESGNTRQFLDDIDRERDQFQAELDLKAEKLAEMKDLFNALQKKYDSSEESRASLKDQVETLTAHLSSADKECSKLSREVAESLAACQKWETQAKQHQIENQRLGSDLVALTRENQIMNGELSETANARDNYLAELREVENQLNSLNEYVKSKDDEKQEIMNNYRKLIADHERLDLAYRSNMEELNHLRMEVVSRDKKLISLERQLDSVTRDATQFQIDNNAHIKQSSNLSRALASSERQVKQLEVEKQRLSREVQACRDLAHSVDRNKDSLQAQFVQLTLERDRLVHLMEKDGTEKHAIEAELKTANLKADRLEQLLNIERTRKMESEKSSIDIKQSRVEMEMKLKEWSENQESTIESMKTQLNDTKKELDASATKIAHLEAILSEKDKDLGHIFQDLGARNAELAKIKEQLKMQENTNRDLIRVYGNTQPNAVEMRLLGEISNTQRERQYAETQLESAMLPSYSNESILSKDTAGNNDHSAVSRRMDVVLDTIVQAHDDFN